MNWLVIELLWVQTLLGTKPKLSFCLILFWHGNEEA